jgi:AcrR family transcriptional regulator
VPRAGLSRAAVIDIAVRVVDETGIDGLSLAAVAADAGVAVPSLYKHVGSLADLRRGVAVVGIQQLARRAAAATVGRSGEDALRELGRAIRAFAAEHPGLYAATQVAPHADDPADSEQALAAGDAVAIIAAVLRGFGLPEPALVPAVRAVRSAVHGFVDLEAHGGFGLPDDLDRSFEVLLDVLVVGLRAAEAA